MDERHKGELSHTAHMSIIHLWSWIWLFCDFSLTVSVAHNYSKNGTILHGGPKFGPLPPLSRDSICMPSQVWSTYFFFEIFDHMINSRRIRRFGPFRTEKMD